MKFHRILSDPSLSRFDLGCKIWYEVYNDNAERQRIMFTNIIDFIDFMEFLAFLHNLFKNLSRDNALGISAYTLVLLF